MPSNWGMFHVEHLTFTLSYTASLELTGGR